MTKSCTTLDIDAIESTKSAVEATRPPARAASAPDLDTDCDVIRHTGRPHRLRVIRGRCCRWW